MTTLVDNGGRILTALKGKKKAVAFIQPLKNVLKKKIMLSEAYNNNNNYNKKHQPLNYVTDGCSALHPENFVQVLLHLSLH